MSGYGEYFRAAKKATKASNKNIRSKASVEANSYAKVNPSESDKIKKLYQQRKNLKHKSRKNMSIRSIASISLGLLISVFALMNLDRLESLLHKVEIRAMGLAAASNGSAKGAPSKGQSKEELSSEISPSGAANTGEKKNWTPEQLSFFNKLEDRKKELDQKEVNLQKLEEELQQQKVALEKRFKELEDLREKISSKLEEKVKTDQGKVDKLVEFYSNMKPQNAAKIFENLDEDLAIEILSKMKKKSAADIMNLLKSEKAQRLSEKFAGYRRQ